jgi:hypothetical protein
VSELPPHAIAEVQRILDHEARLALADELDVDPARIRVGPHSPNRAGVRQQDDTRPRRITRSMSEADAINALRNASRKESRTLWRDAIKLALDEGMTFDQMAGEVDKTPTELKELASWP